MLIVLILLLLILIGGAVSVFAFFSYANKVIEESAIEDLDTENMYSLIYQKTTIYDKEGEEIDALYLSGGNRTLIKYEDLPEDLINALVDTEDKTFWEHHGFNYIRMIGAVKEKIFGGGEISGTSTITQQLARNIYLAETKSDRTLERKILEMHYTKILEEELTKKQILEAYFNAVYFGFNAYGIQAASESYFNKEPKDLDLLECAALAALVPQLRKAAGTDGVRGVEGDAAARYFEAFNGLLVAQRDAFAIRGRNRRPPLDSMNALLSFHYSLLAHDCTGALESVGLDPQIGFLHAPRPGRDSLALDLMEEFRAPLADRAALSLVNLQQLGPKDFKTSESGAVEMTEAARKTVLLAWQKKKQETILHPFLGEKVEIGLLPYVQALLLARHLRGELDAYPPFLLK